MLRKTIGILFIFILVSFPPSLVSIYETHPLLYSHYSVFNILYGSSPIRMVIDGREITNLPEPPLILNDSVLVPAREAFEGLGAQVAWDGTNRQIYIIYQNQVLIMTLGQTAAFLDGRQIEMTLPPILHNEKTMIPLRFPAECFGFGVEWRAEERAAYLYSPVTHTEPDPGHSFYQPEDTVYAHETPSSPSAANPDALARDKSPAPITPMEFAETNITALHTPAETGSAVYAIHASSPISVVEKFLLADNRLVIDIYNANCHITGPFYYDDSVPVTGIRASQFMDYPKVTRLVFDLKSNAEFSITLSEDRRSLLVSFEQNVIHEVRFASTGTSDSIIITGNSQPLVSVSQAQNPDRLVISITNAQMNVTGDQQTQGVFAYRVNVSQHQDMGYVEAFVHDIPNYNIEYGHNSVTVRLFRSNLSGLQYDPQRRELHISKENGFNMNIFAVVHTDEYARNRYTLTLPVNAEGILGYGDLQINDGFIHSIAVEQDTFGQTRLVIHNARVLTFAISETNEAYIIRAHAPREGSPPVVIIDPGHGGTAPGSTSGGMMEKNLNLSIALKLKQLLDNEPSVVAYFTRTDDRDVSLEDRATFANANGDIFISIHGNAMRNNSTSHGIETYFWPHDNDAALGFSCQQLAHIMQRNMLASTGAFDRGVKSDHLTVLRETTIPAVLCEVGFMTNPAEAAKLATEEYQWQIARGLFNGIMEAFAVYSPRR